MFHGYSIHSPDTAIFYTIYKTIVYKTENSEEMVVNNRIKNVYINLLTKKQETEWGDKPMGKGFSHTNLSI